MYSIAMPTRFLMKETDGKTMAWSGVTLTYCKPDTWNTHLGSISNSKIITDPLIINLIIIFFM